MTRHRIKTTVLSLLAAVSTVFMAGTATRAEDKPACKSVSISDMGWSDIALTNATSEFVLKALGYEPKQLLLALNVTFDSLKRGEIDVFLGNWRPVQDIDYKGYFDRGDIIPVGTNLVDAKYTLAVPRYVSDAGLKSFDDLQKFADKLDHKIYGIEPGSNKPLLDMLAAHSHGLDGDWQVVESSEAGMLAQVNRALQNKEWIVFLGWQPHPMNVNIDMTYLSGGDVEFGPNFGGATVRTVVRRGYPADCPNVSTFFKNLKFDIKYENTGMDMVQKQGLEAAAVAAQMMKDNPGKLESWLQGVTTIDGKPGLPAVKSALGIK